MKMYKINILFIQVNVYKQNFERYARLLIICVKPSMGSSSTSRGLCPQSGPTFIQFIGIIARTNVMNPNIPTIRFFKSLDIDGNTQPCFKIVSIFSYAIYLPIRLLSMQVCHISVCMPPRKRIVSQQQPREIKYRQRRLLVTYFLQCFQDKNISRLHYYYLCCNNKDISKNFVWDAIQYLFMFSPFASCIRLLYYMIFSYKFM